MVVLPVVPGPCLLLHPVVVLFLIGVSIHLVFLALLGLPFRSCHCVVILHLPHLFERYRRFVGVFLPHLSDQFLLGLGWAHAMLDFFFGWDLPHFHFGNRLRHVLLMPLFSSFILLNGFLVFQNAEFFLDSPKHGDRLVDLNGDVVLDGLPFFALFLDFLPIRIP